MQNAVSKVMASASMIALVSAHGFILSPSPRMPGSAMSDACGEQMYNNQMGDNYGNVQGELQVTNGQTDFDAAACNVWLCKGYKYDDNTDNVQEYTVGQEITATVFEPGAVVDVVGTSKGKGTAGVMKRHGFKGLGAAHGTQRKHRSPGSIGACATPARVFKGTRMAGRMGHARTTTMNLTVHAVDAERGLLLIKGAVPGPRGGTAHATGAPLPGSSPPGRGAIKPPGIAGHGPGSVPLPP